MKRIRVLLLCLAAAALLCLLPKDAYAATSGSCGTNLSWKLESGTLTISGTGDMNSYSSKSSPWYANTSIKKIVIKEGVTSVGNYAFDYCTSVTSVSLPSTLSYIGDGGFNYCTSLKTVNLPQSLQRIGSEAFKFNAMSSLVLPENLTHIGYNAFYGNNIHTIVWSEKLSYIGAYAFKYNSFTTLELPDSITFIGPYAFESCALSSVQLGDGLTQIGNNIFDGNSNLTTIKLGNNVQNISADAFSKLTALKYNTYGGANYLGNDNSDYAALIKYVPSEYINCNVHYDTTVIAENAFSSCSNLTIVGMGPAVKYINAYAFAYCSNLKYCDLPETVCTIGDGAFRECTALERIYLSGNLTSLGSLAFYMCSTISEVVIPNSLQEIKEYAFYGCNLQTLYTGENVTTIGERAFAINTLLYWVEFGPALKTISPYAFYNCRGLGYLSIPKGVTSIGQYAFMGARINHVAYAGTQERWSSVTVGSNTELTSAQYFHYEASIYSKRSCTTSGVYCSACQAFLKSDTIENGSHTYTNGDDMTCNYCDYTRTLSAMEIAELPDKVQYNQYLDQLDVTGAVIRLTYSDNTTVEKPMTLAMTSGFNNSTVGECSVTVTVEGITQSFAVQIVKVAPTGLRIERMPHKVEYFVDNTVVITGLTVCAMYETGDEVVIGYGNLTFQMPDMSTAGKKTVKITYEGVSTEYTIYVHAGTMITLDQSLYPESEHGYANNTDQTWVVRHEGANKLVLTFDQYSCIDKNYDYLYIYNDDTGEQIASLTGELAGQSVIVNSHAVRLDFKTDSEVTQYGFAFASIQAEVLAHDWVLVSCDQPVVCAVCDLIGEVWGHTGDLWVDLTQPTCTEAGIKARICSTCGETETQEISALGHSYSSVITEPTCTKEGFTTYTCSACGDTYTDTPVAAMGHSYGDWTQSVAPTCTEIGKEQRTCATCGATEEQDVAALGHTNTSVVTQPTCTVEGYTTNTCSVCGEVTITDVVAAKGHGWSAWIQTVAPSCTKEGSRVRFCNCGVKETEVLPKTHTAQNGVCTACGALESYYWVLSADADVTLELQQDLYVDLNGFDLTGTLQLNGFKVYGMDSTTDGYTCDAIGYMNCTDENGAQVVPVTQFKSDVSGSVKRYMTIENENGYSFHRFYLGVTHMSLKPTTVGVGYKAVFYGDAMVAANLDSFGFTMCLDGNDPVTVSKAGESFVSGKIVTLRVDNFDVERHGETKLYASVMLKLKDGTVIESTRCEMTMRSMMELLNTNYAALTADQLTAVADLVKKYAIIQTWKVENLVTE